MSRVQELPSVPNKTLLPERETPMTHWWRFYYKEGEQEQRGFLSASDPQSVGVVGSVEEWWRVVNNTLLPGDVADVKLSLFRGPSAPVQPPTRGVEMFIRSKDGAALTRTVFLSLMVVAVGDGFHLEPFGWCLEGVGGQYVGCEGQLWVWLRPSGGNQRDASAHVAQQIKDVADRCFQLKTRNVPLTARMIPETRMPPSGQTTSYGSSLDRLLPDGQPTAAKPSIPKPVPKPHTAPKPVPKPVAAVKPQPQYESDDGW
ncbi:MAG: hypothetical protein KVP17_001810 [Porospora cf. gigantea B]|uniref:uncharacterized protein n=1 Tax=Porospora cf. gigantea B TaxID=2853592 RepID=UPI0035719D18|nr:MAG: hypothetical protein KVP17_001810 [Porospora cf. gigantea B]